MLTKSFLLLYENVLLANVVDENIAVMIMGLARPEDIITVIVIFTYEKNEAIANVLSLMSLPIDSKPRLLDERISPACQAHRNTNEDLVFEFCFNREFGDNLHRADVRCVTYTTIVKIRLS